MPWGRAIESATDSVESAIERERLDSQSAGSRFAARADLIHQQISGISNIATQYRYQFPDFTRSKAAGSLGGPNVVLESPVISLNPPKPTGEYRVILICQMNCRQTAGTGNLEFSAMQLSVNSKIYAQAALEENRSQGTPTMSLTLSMAAWDSVSNGQASSVQFGLLVNSLDAKTIEFTGCSVTAVYVGAL